MASDLMEDQLFSSKLDFQLTDSPTSSSFSDTNNPPSPFSDASLHDQHPQDTQQDAAFLDLQLNQDLLNMPQMPSLSAIPPLSPEVPPLSVVKSEACAVKAEPLANADPEFDDVIYGKAKLICKRQRNKMSALKYRNKKKQYVECLEGDVKELKSQLEEKNKKIDSLESENKLLKDQIAFLKKIVKPTIQKTGIVLFVLFSCFLVFNPTLLSASMSSSSTVSSTSMAKDAHATGRLGRVLLWVDESHEAAQHMPVFAPPLVAALAQQRAQIPCNSTSHDLLLPVAATTATTQAGDRSDRLRELV